MASLVLTYAMTGPDMVHFYFYVKCFRHSVPRNGYYEVERKSCLVEELREVYSAVFRIRIQGSSGSGSRSLKKVKNVK